jgi:hypothetical protein
MLLAQMVILAHTLVLTILTSLVRVVLLIIVIFQLVVMAAL